MESLFQRRLIADGQRKLTIRVPIKHFLKTFERVYAERRRASFPVAHAILIRSEHHVAIRTVHFDHNRLRALNWEGGSVEKVGAQALGHYANISTVWSSCS
jgi:hypothetical protein